MEKIRINKFLGNLGVASRREIDSLIDQNRIKVNGILATSGEKVSSNDSIEIDGKEINLKKESKKVYFLLNKPEGVISASKDDRNRTTIVDLIDTDERIFPIGRLDLNTEGAIILTNDGELFNKIVHPRTEVYKEYRAEVRWFLSDERIEELEDGVPLEDGVTLPAKVVLIERNKSYSIVEISIREGRNRQVRRMLEYVGNRVEKLTRLKIGDIDLHGLEVGEYRELTEKEIEYLYSLGE